MTRSRLLITATALLTVRPGVAPAQTVAAPDLPHLLFVTRARPETSLSLSVSADRRPFTTTRARIEGDGEMRLGPRAAIEVVVPVETLTGGPGVHVTGVGDVAAGVKLALRDDPRRTHVLVGLIVSLPTGAPIWGFGEGTTVFKPYAAAARSWSRWMLQGDIRAEIPKRRYATDPVRYVSYDIVAAAHLGHGGWLAGMGARGTDAAFAITPQLLWRITAAVELGAGIKVPLNPPRPFATDTTVWTASLVWTER